MKVLVSLVSTLCASAAWAQPAPDAPAPGEPAPIPAPEPVAEPSPAPPAPAPLPSPPAAPKKAEPKLKVQLGKGVSVESADGKERLDIRARIQLRFSQFSEAPGDPPNVTEFQARRIRLLFQGHVLGGELEYYLQLAFSNLDNEPDLRSPTRDAYMTFTRWRDLNVRWGQMKVPFGKQRVVSSSAQEMVDRSIVVGELNLDRDVGIQLLSSDLGGVDGKLAYHVGLFHGDGRNRLATTPGVLVVGRFAVRPFGKFEDTDEADHDRYESPKLALAINAAYNANTNRSRSTFNETFEFARFDYTHAAADVVFKYRGLNLQSELLYRKADRDLVERVVDGMTETERARNAWGFYVQGGYLANEHLEVTARYGEIRPIGDEGAIDALQREVGGGLNWYFQEHALKIQSDYFVLTESGSDAEHQLRVQTQLYF